MAAGDAGIDRFKDVHALLLCPGDEIHSSTGGSSRGGGAGSCAGLGRRERRRIVVHAVKLRRRAIDVHLENVRPVVVAGKVMPELHLDGEIEIALGVENAFLRSHRPGDDARQRVDDQRAAAAVRIAQEFLALGAGLQRLDHVIVHGAAGRDHERLAHLREGLRVDGDAVAQRIAAGREMIGPAHDVNAGAFGDQREHRERIGVLAADQPRHRPELGREGAEGVAIAAHVDQPLADRRHDLLVLADDRAVRPEIDLRVEHGAGGVRQLLAHADDDIGVGVAGGFAERRGLGPGISTAFLNSSTASLLAMAPVAA